MHSHSIETWRHRHDFLGTSHARNERRTVLVVGLTLAMMVAEIVGGTIFGSMALTADGWHMSTHAAALGIAALAYRFARLHADDPRFAFGTAKLGDLSAFASAIILAMIALAIGYESLTRLGNPQAIAFGEALPIAILGLLVNLASAWLLHGDGHDHGHHHDHGHAHHEGHGHADHGDTNLRAAYVHVLADALTSVLAIAALLAGRYLGIAWLDPAMGLVGAAVIVAWSWSLIRSAGATLLDAVPDRNLAHSVRTRLETNGDTITDLHLWRLGPGHTGLIVSLVSDHPQEPAAYKAKLADLEGLSHITVEANICPNHGAEQIRA
ncbi:CDF family Co(II)/Ni(II) efflux transporter DmeF [Methylobacterium sp. SD274]|uniref:CDF family Co(II)/Ni(II) efflux transporter DmeF n=1 Tax=Methylobacterium sp. SD274 TaxID=2782009 RepID=UPI001A959A83|nr:CDF family Co(II)/Ni(II) efflux transporter DmeF [Methylobacterium sp. SD274]MBO1022239.1 CDF family Co(II)/Ni(II) efflux transporter DmeF [Methylobacterium sp. SD274]